MKVRAETCEGAATPGDAWIGNCLVWHRLAMEWHSRTNTGNAWAWQSNGVRRNDRQRDGFAAHGDGIANHRRLRAATAQQRMQCKGKAL